ncbi:hypothetical protein CDN99_24490 [Roseateles aquatilis]|uniref:Uncharacterized protein n=1 Tax=Roseateles aquatilis TaxID=431061 RepID=A0A246IW53_9BURK|nr:hypothetical protein [Roseateles aquatilis]OWQ84451.1 hypothetical protein CDN99_24490 [Roseateles aquatilis]
MLSRPPWIRIPEADRRAIGFLWDDARGLEQRDHAAPVSEALLQGLSPRAALALAVAVHEWIVWRFEGLESRADPLLVLQAGWCATVDPRYLAYCELRRTAWVGPIAGPLWCAYTWLQRGLTQARQFSGDLHDSIRVLVRLARHVMPAGAGFDAWLEAIGPRLLAHSPPPVLDPADDLFDDELAERLGPLVGPSVLNPMAVPDPVGDRAFLEQQFADARAQANPLLATPKALVDAGFFGVPYVVPRC